MARIKGIKSSWRNPQEQTMKLKSSKHIRKHKFYRAAFIFSNILLLLSILYILDMKHIINLIGSL